jgi:HlyD family secretion protein
VKKYFKTTIIVIVILTLIVPAIIKGVIRRKRDKSSHTTVRIEEVKRGELSEFVSAPGEIEPKSKVEISAKVSARVVELPFEEGDEVSGGDPDATPPVPGSLLIRLDSKDLESQLRSARASYKAQSAQINVEKSRVASQKSSLEGTASLLKQAESDMQRQKQLLESQDISQSTFDQTKCTYDELKARYEAAMHSLKASELNIVVLQHNLEAAEARIEEAEESLSYTTIRSPINGTVIRLNAEVGEVVMTGTMNNPGTIIMEVGDLSQMLVVAQVDEADIGGVEVGQRANVEIQSFPNTEFTGVVDTIALTHRMSNNGTKYYRTEILLDKFEENLYSGLTADVDIQTQKHENILKVPSQAVMARPMDGLPLEIRENSEILDKNKIHATVVYRCVDGKAVVTPVKIGNSDLTHTIVTAGISEGDKIVIGPYKELDGLKHDQKIKDEKEVEAEKKAKEKKAKKKERKDIKSDPNMNKS